MCHALALTFVICHHLSRMISDSEDVANRINACAVAFIVLQNEAKQTVSVCDTYACMRESAAQRLLNIRKLNGVSNYALKNIETYA